MFYVFELVKNRRKYFIWEQQQPYDKNSEMEYTCFQIKL